ncbi:MAG: S8 family peptidase, partial [bacterium]
AMPLHVTAVAAAQPEFTADAAAKNRFTNNAYIVQLAEPPVSAYTGGIKGLKATKPRRGQKIDPNSPAVINYMSFLASRQETVLNAVGGGRKLHSYGYVFNGFAADLTPEQVSKLSSMPGVLAVTKDEFRSLDTATTPAFLGLTGPTGVWAGDGYGGATGEGVIIGIVDSGVWPEHPSFSDRTGSNGNASKDGKLAYQQIPGWNGRCVPGEDFAASNCNQKLIGARFYNEGFGGNAGIDAELPFEFNSPRDHNGHGTHTATTAGGNADVAVSGAESAYGAISGIAPRARIAAYKACWSVPGTAGSCSGVDLVAAIDQAVADGVDVINYSISGSRTNFRDPVEIAFLFAADAGVFVAASAGNSGPTTATVAHPSPWITTVAAGTHDRALVDGSVTLGNGRTFTSSTGTIQGVGPNDLVDAAASGLPGADGRLALCFGTTDDGIARLDPAKVAGKIVVCERGGNALFNKALAVLDAGGVGMVLVNTPTSLTSTPFVPYPIPAVHLTSDYFADLKGYVAQSGATATINAATIVTGQAAPFTANFSSRGPLQASGDLLKPDIIAPGQEILAGVAPPNNAGKLFDLYSGTSMSSPHVAGIAALLKSFHPTWSPMAIKSAIMTTAGDVLDGPNTDSTVIFRQGAGHVDPPAALNPGLVFDSGFDDWLGFLCGTQLPADFCTSSGIPVLEPSNFNGASIAISNLAGSKTVNRRLTNVSGSQATFSASAVMPGFTVSVSPAQLALAAGETGEVAITVTRAGAALNTYGGGQLTWSSGPHEVRIPIVARPVALGAPAAVTGTASGVSYEVVFGYDGPFTATARGPVPAALTAGTVNQDPDQIFDINDATGTVAIPVVVPAGTTYVRFALFTSDVTPGSDIDLYVAQGSTLVGASTNGDSTEEVNFSFGAPTGVDIPLTVYVHGWGVAGGGSTPFTLHQWSLGATPALGTTISAPATATTGGTGTISVGYSGLAPATKYLGSVAYGGAAGLPAPTIIRVDTP